MVKKNAECARELWIKSYPEHVVEERLWGLYDRMVEYNIIGVGMFYVVARW